MKTLLTKILLIIPFIMTANCSEQNSATPSTGNPSGDHIKITVGSHEFRATLESNKTATAFLAKLPITVRMNDLHSNEKYCSLAQSLPTHSSNPGKIFSGDIMLFGSSTLVLFYESFSTSYSYSRIGKVKDPSGLKKALGSGSATVKFEKGES